MRIAFVVEVFPSLSQTFVLNQVVGLIEQGHEVDIYAEIKGDSHKIHPDVEKYDLLKRTYITLKLPIVRLRGLKQAFLFSCATSSKIPCWR